MKTKELLTGSSEAWNRQGILSSSGRGEPLVLESCDGQTIPQVSTAGIWTGLATAEEGLPLSRSFPELKSVPEEKLPSYGNAPLELGEFISLREQ